MEVDRDNQQFSLQTSNFRKFQKNSSPKKNQNWEHYENDLNSRTNSKVDVRFNTKNVKKLFWAYNVIYFSF